MLNILDMQKGSYRDYLCYIKVICRWIEKDQNITIREGPAWRKHKNHHLSCSCKKTQSVTRVLHFFYVSLTSILINAEPYQIQPASCENPKTIKWYDSLERRAMYI